MKKLGFWWNDKNIEVYKINNRNIALYGWNGYKYINCFEVSEKINNNFFKIIKDNIEVEPIYNNEKIIDFIIIDE